MSAADGLEALEVLEGRVPDMILLDIMMPRMDGFEMLARLKASESWRHVPVIIISAMSDLANVVKGIEMGADDYLPKPFNPVILEARLNAGLEKKHLHDLEQAYTRSLERELEIGKEIQAGFLPVELPTPEGWEIASYFRAAREVAGDFYDVFALADKEIAFMVGDVTDKGVGSALYMALYRTLLRAMISEDDAGPGPRSLTAGGPGLPNGEAGMAVKSGQRPPTAESHDDRAPELGVKLNIRGRLTRAVTKTNRYICQVHEAPQFVTLFLGVLDPADGSVTYISAGHDPSIHLRNGTIYQEVMPTGPAIGLFEDAVFETGELSMQDGDILFMYTDGGTDVQNEEGERFGQERLRAVLERGLGSPGGLLDHITSSIDAFAQKAERFDDVTLLALGRKL